MSDTVTSATALWGLAPPLPPDVDEASVLGVAHQVALALAGTPTSTPPLRSYTKNQGGQLAPDIRRYLEKVDGAMMVQYDGLNKSGNVTKNFECLPLSAFLVQESGKHRGRRTAYAEWSVSRGGDYSSYHRYYNITPSRAVRLFVDFDQPRDPVMLCRLRDKPELFYDAIRAFVRGLGEVLPGFEPDWVAIFRSGGGKLSAHLQDMRIWATDVTAFAPLVQRVCDLPGPHGEVLRAIVDTCIYAGERAWRVPGCCKRSASGAAPRFLALHPDAAMSGEEALRQFAATTSDDRVACVSWAAFCYPHAMSTATFERGHRVVCAHEPARPRCKRDRGEQLAHGGALPEGRALVAPWLHDADEEDEDVLSKTEERCALSP